MSRKLTRFMIHLDSETLLYFPGSFLTGAVVLEVEDETPALGKFSVLLPFHIFLILFPEILIHSKYVQFFQPLIFKSLVKVLFWLLNEEDFRTTIEKITLTSK